MVFLLFAVMLVGSVFGGEGKLSKCEVKYNRCIFNCAQSYPLNEKKRLGCETRCELEKGVCVAITESKAFIEEALEYLEGFSGSR